MDAKNIPSATVGDYDEILVTVTAAPTTYLGFVFAFIYIFTCFGMGKVGEPQEAYRYSDIYFQAQE